MALLPGDDAPYVFESLLPATAEGVRLLDYLADRFSYQTRTVWESRVRDGSILLDGCPWKDPEAILPGAGMFAYVHGSYEEPIVPTHWRVLNIAENWMAVSKPAGMPVHSTPRIFRQSLTWQVRRMFGEGWSPVHRLDRDTSGLVLFARGAMLPVLGGWFSDRRVSKRYLALVHGEPYGEFEVDAPLGRAGDPRIAMKVGVIPDGKECRTAFRVLGKDANGRGTWLEARPHQGRLHQIRAHLEFAGFPIVGDLLYDAKGGDAFLARAADATPETVAGMVGSERMWLHAYSLGLPASNHTIPRQLVCPLEEAGLIPWLALDGLPMGQCRLDESPS